jgi:hypothetical protein
MTPTPDSGEFRRGRLRWGNRGPLQRLKLRVALERFGHMAETFNRVGFQAPPGVEVAA